jgi:hypothetical protein
LDPIPLQFGSIPLIFDYENYLCTMNIIMTEQIPAESIIVKYGWDEILSVFYLKDGILFGCHGWMSWTHVHMLNLYVSWFT